MKTAYWTAIGAMLIPVGVVLLIDRPEKDILAYFLIIAGFISFIAGWIYTIREERRNSKETELRIRREKASLIVQRAPGIEGVRGTYRDGEKGL